MRKRRRQALLVHEALVEPAVLAEEEALVGRVDDDRVVGEPFRVEAVEQPADVLVDRCHAAQVILHVELVRPAAQLVAFQLRRELASRSGLFMFSPTFMLRPPTASSAVPS